MAVLHLLLALQATSGVKSSSGVKFVENLRITPDRPACVGSRAFPVLRARIEPWDNVSSARLVFRPQGYPHWYSVPMQRTADDFVGLLPKPRPSAQRVVYFVEAEAYKQRVRSLEHTAAVVEDAAECRGQMAPHMETAALVVTVPKGAPPVPPVPPGFEPVGAVGEQPRGSTGRDSVITLGVLAAAGGTAALLKGEDPPIRTPQDNITPELAVLETVPPPESRISLAQGAVLSVRVRLKMHQAVLPGLVTVMLYRASDGVLRPCGVLRAPHEGLAQGQVREILLTGPLEQARTCEPSDRVRVSVTQFGQEFIATGSPGLPDATLRYFVSP
jgi:hypothetical protein